MNLQITHFKNERRFYNIYAVTDEKFDEKEFNEK